ncbi:unnamed protein product, partial [Discosporangium mesarthrocarpum]
MDSPGISRGTGRKGAVDGDMGGSGKKRARVAVDLDLFASGAAAASLGATDDTPASLRRGTCDTTTTRSTSGSQTTRGNAPTPTAMRGSKKPAYAPQKLVRTDRTAGSLDAFLRPVTPSLPVSSSSSSGVITGQGKAKGRKGSAGG